MQFGLDFGCARVTEGVQQTFASNSINFLADCGMQSPGYTFHDKVKLHRRCSCEFLRYPQKGLLKIVTLPRQNSYSEYGLSNFLNNLPQKFENMKVHRGTAKTMQQRGVPWCYMHGFHEPFT